MSFGVASFLRVIQMRPIPVCFISITNGGRMWGCRGRRGNQVSGIINFMRNVGGSIMIAVTGAAVTNRGLFHQARLQESMRMTNPVFAERVQGITAALKMGGRGAQGAVAAQASIYQQLQQQAAALSYADIYMALCWMSCGTDRSGPVLAEQEGSQEMHRRMRRRTRGERAAGPPRLAVLRHKLVALV